MTEATIIQEVWNAILGITPALKPTLESTFKVDVSGKYILCFEDTPESREITQLFRKSGVSVVLRCSRKKWNNPHI